MAMSSPPIRFVVPHLRRQDRAAAQSLCPKRFAYFKLLRRDHGDRPAAPHCAGKDAPTRQSESFVDGGDQ